MECILSGKTESNQKIMRVGSVFLLLLLIFFSDHTVRITKTKKKRERDGEIHLLIQPLIKKIQFIIIYETASESLLL